jgi:hypothetical protein
MRLALVALLGACGDALSDARYAAPEAPPSWCRVGAGAYAYLWRPSTSPALVTGSCDPGPAPTDSTLAELVVEPGTAVDLDVSLPDAFAGCMVDSVVLAHGIRAGELVIDLAGEPVVAYDEMPHQREPLVRDDPSVVARQQTPQPSPGVATEVRLAVDAIHGGVVTLVASIGSGTEITPIAPARELWLIAVRHRIGLPAPARTFAITLRAGQTAFSIGVRGQVESKDPPLRFRASAEAAPVPTGVVPQAAVVLTHCTLPATAALDAITRE